MGFSWLTRAAKNQQMPFEDGNLTIVSRPRLGYINIPEYRKYLDIHSKIEVTAIKIRVTIRELYIMSKVLRESQSYGLHHSSEG